MTQAVLTPENARQVIKKYGGIECSPVSAPDKGVIIGIYGPGGIGKTTTAATITDTELGAPGILLNARGNPHVVSSYSDRLDVIDITQFKQVEAIRQDFLKDKDFPYKSIILDNVSEMWMQDLRDLYGPIADIGWEKHAASSADVAQLVRNFIDMAETWRRVNIVFVFQETPETRTIRGQEVKSRSELGFNKALQGHVPSLINYLGRLYQVSDHPNYTRMLDFSPIETMHQAKLQIDPKDPVLKQIPYEQYNPSLASLVDTIRGHQPWPVAKHARPPARDR